MTAVSVKPVTALVKVLLLDFTAMPSSVINASCATERFKVVVAVSKLASEACPPDGVDEDVKEKPFPSPDLFPVRTIRWLPVVSVTTVAVRPIFAALMAVLTSCKEEPAVMDTGVAATPLTVKSRVPAPKVVPAE